MATPPKPFIESQSIDESTTPSTMPTEEFPLTPEQAAYLNKGDYLMTIEKKILINGTAHKEEKKFLDKKISREKKLSSGQYSSLAEMATDINGGSHQRKLSR